MIRMMGPFGVETDGKLHDSLPVKNRKGVSVLQFLILEEGKPVSDQRLMRELWPSDRNDNPESALKATVSRLRASLNEVWPHLGQCIVFKCGLYQWQEMPGVQVDVLEILRLLRQPMDGAAIDRLQALYRGDLYQTGDLPMSVSLANWLHNAYLTAVYCHVEAVKDDPERVCAVCQRALQVDPENEDLRIILTQALCQLDAPEQAADVSHGLSAQPESVWREVVESGSILHESIERMRADLMRAEELQKGPFFCEYSVFREVYNIYMRTLERLGSSMFLAMIMLGEVSSAARRESCMAALQELLKANMRKGDIITRFSENSFALLLPTVNYHTGGMVMERIETRYYAEIPGAVPFHARIVPMTSLGSTELKEPWPQAQVDTA